MSSEENKEVKEIKVSADVRQFADKAAKEIIVKADASSDVNGDFYIDALADATGIEKEKLNEIPKFDALFVPACALAVGEQANALFAKDPELKRVTVDVPSLDGQHFTFDIRRESRGLNPRTKEEVTSYGVISASHTTRSVANIGDYGKVRQLLKQQGESLFGG